MTRPGIGLEVKKFERMGLVEAEVIYKKGKTSRVYCECDLSELMAYGGGK